MFDAQTSESGTPESDSLTEALQAAGTLRLSSSRTILFSARGAGSAEPRPAEPDSATRIPIERSATLTTLIRNEPWSES